MSDDKSRTGYDDVLSSVRRIVASEVEAATAQASSDKLLLTPALRVADPVDSPAEVPALTATSAQAEAPDAVETSADAVNPEAGTVRDFPTLAERIAELEASVGGEAADWEPDGSEDQGQHMPDAVILPLNPAARRGETRGDPRDVAEDDIVFAVPGEDPEADETPVDADDNVHRDPVPAESDAANPSQDGASAPAEATPAFASFRHRDKPDEPATPRASQPAEAAGDDEPAILDEMALRDLVAEIVREELQGGLGERITRNVRKLVRAEIQRAFAARDLD